MSRQGINTGFAPNDGNGDSLLDGAVKINQNFSEIYSTFGDGTNLVSYATIAGYSTSSGVSTYATSSTYATIAGYSTSSGVSTSSGYATIAGYSTSSGISTQTTKLQNSRTFEITGDIVGAAVTFDGTGNVSIAATIQPNSVGLGTDTTGDYVQSISGTSNQISVSVTSGESSTPTLSIPNQFTIPQDATVTRDLQVNRNLNVNGNITIGGTSASLFSQTLSIFDPDIVLGYRTDAFGNDVSNDTTANHGGVALASTEGTPLVDLFIAGIETNPSTYKKIMWFKSGSFAGLNTDAWLFNYGVGIGSTQVPNGVRLAVGGVQVTDTAVTAATFSGNATTATTAGYATTAGISTVAQGLTGTPNINVYNVGVASAINVGAASTFQSSVHFESDLLIGDADELQIYHNGVNSYIDNFSGNNLVIRDNGTGIQLRRYGAGPGAGLMASFNSNAGVELYYDSVLKFQTFQNGVAINDSVGIGSTAGNPPYRLTVSGVGATITQGLANAIADFTSSVNGYGQVNVRNSLSGTNASGDIVVTANSGNDTSNFIDLGINNAGFTTSSWTINGALDGYLYTSDGNLSIGAASASKYLSLFAGGTLAANEQVRVTSTGVGIGTTNPQTKVEINGVLGFTGSNIKIGNVSTGSSITTGSNNNFFGPSAGQFTTSGSNNNFLGDQAGYNNIDGFGNNFLGAAAGISNISGYYNHFSGVYAGYANTTGSNNVYIGYAAGSNETGSENVIIGSNQSTPILNGSNQLVIGAVSGTWINGNSSYNVGIGTTNPTSKLTVTGDAKITGVTTTTTLNVGTGGTVITTTVAGSVGIGTTNPTNTLTVYGPNATIRINDTANNASTTIAYGSITLNSNGVIQQIGDTQYFRAGQNGSSSYYFDNYYSGSSHELFYIDTNGSIRAAGDAKITGITTTARLNVGTGGTVITTTVAGLVGIGTTNPQTKLQIDGVLGFTDSNTKIGNVSTGSSITTGSNNNFIGVGAGQSNTTGSDNIFIGQNAGNNNQTGTGNIIIGKDQQTPILNGSNQLVIGSGFRTWIHGNSSSNVGIGVTNPSSKLTVAGQFQSTANNNNITGGGQIYLNGGTGNRIDFAGVGTAAPRARNSILGRSEGTKIVLSPGVSDASDVDYAVGIETNALWYSVPSSGQQFKWYAGITTVATLFGTGELVVGSATSTGTSSQPLQVTGGAYVSGSVGIGTTNPARKLDVRGEATFGSGITASDLSWGKDTNQLVYTFSGTASGTNPADGCIAIVNPNANPSGSRVGSLVYGNKVSGTSVTGNPGLKAGIDCSTNTNVANAADTGGYLNFYTKPDNGDYRSQMSLNSNGVLTKPYQPAFLAYRNSTLSVTGGTWQNISSGMLTESYDVGSVYSTSTNGRFVAPVAGKYMFYAGGFSAGNTSGERYAFGVKINNVGSPDFLTGGNYCITDTPLVPYQIVLNLAANDYVELHYFSAISTTIGGTTHVLYWGGYLLG